MRNSAINDKTGGARFTAIRLKADMGESVSGCCGRVLNLVEAQLGASPNWAIIRRQLLNAFGERGLARDVEHIIDATFTTGSEL